MTCLQFVEITLSIVRGICNVNTTNANSLNLIKYAISTLIVKTSLKNSIVLSKLILIVLHEVPFLLTEEKFTTMIWTAMTVQMSVKKVILVQWRKGLKIPIEETLCGCKVIIALNLFVMKRNFKKVKCLDYKNSTNYYSSMFICNLSLFDITRHSINSFFIEQVFWKLLF